MAYVDAEANMAFQERFIRAILSRVAEEGAEDLVFLGRDPAELVFGPESFPVVLYDEAVAILGKAGSSITWGEDLSVEDEEVLTRGFDRPFFIYKYPVRCRAFYIEPDPLRPELALSSDCLMHGRLWRDNHGEGSARATTTSSRAASWNMGSGSRILAGTSTSGSTGR